MKRKVVFANSLRGLAAVSVMIAHLCAVYFDSNAYISGRLGFERVTSTSNHSFIWFCNNVFNIGVIGVAVFFLISGFVIDYSLKKLNTGDFLTQRFFRIYPTYIFCLAVCLGLICAFNMFSHGELPDYLDAKYIISNFLLVNQTVGIPDINFVSWSLSVELKFYILMALMYRFPEKNRLTATLAMSLVLCVFYLIVHGSYGGGYLEFFLQDFKYLPFMLVGFYLNRVFERSCGSVTGISFIVFSCFIFFATELISDNVLIKRIVVVNYAIAIILFATCYLFREKFKSGLLLDFLANISYPLYLIHSVLGYYSINIMMRLGYSFSLSFFVAASLSIMCAYFIHLTIEMRSLQLGKRVASPPPANLIK
ncbi:acyltransferase [Erwinia sp. 9145]|uniref:acyltransferase family protein n=1 Tax=Erwinia sp. 9145 TaxID=1500895 RepID=UPI000557ADFF|nr:acyltransferase [Erwinia sp. 9145]